MSSKDPPTNKFCAVPTVIILVGKDKKTFQVHQDRLCEASTFFKAAFEGRFRESSGNKMDLPEEEEHLFELFVQWLYYRRYEIPPEEAKAKSAKFVEPVKLYVLADKYDVGDLRTHLIIKLFAMASRPGGSSPALTTVAYAYEHLPRKSGLCSLLADWYACKVDFYWFKSEKTQEWLLEHPQVAVAVISSFATTTSRATQINPFEGDMPERFREHTQKVPE